MVSTRKRGFSLIESIVSLSIVFLILTATFSVLPGSALANQRADRLLVVQEQLQMLLESQRARPFAELPVGLVENLPGGEGVTASVQVSDLDGINSQEARKIVVKVQWVQQGSAREIQREAVVASNA